MVAGFIGGLAGGWLAHAAPRINTAANTSRRTFIRRCIPKIMAPPIPAPRGVSVDPFIFPGRSPGLSRCPSRRGKTSNSVHEADGHLDRGALSEKIQEHSHTSALGARALDDGHQAAERSRLDLDA